MTGVAVRNAGHANSFVASTLVALVLLAAAADSRAEEAQAVISRAKAEAGSIAAQAEALAKLAWPENGRPDPRLAPLARAELVEFGQHGLAALCDMLRRVDPVFSADVLLALTEARRRITEGVPPEYVPGLQEAVWRGSADACRIAVPELALYRSGPALLACIDRAVEEPALRPTVIRALGEWGDHRARFYLEEVLLRGPAELRPLAAASLAKIGGPAMLPLHGAALSPDPGVRTDALRALIPASGIDDLTTLYEYLDRFPDDDEVLRAEARSRCELLESVLEQRLEFDSASPSPFD